MNASRIKIEHTSSSGNCVLTVMMPTEIANWIMEQAMGWQEKWLCAPSDYEKYKTEEKILEESLKTKNQTT